MWTVSEGFIIILGVIMLFGIISSPPKAKKRERFRDAAKTSGQGAAKPSSPINTPDVFAQQYASGVPTPYAADQKVAGDPDEATKVDKG